jgi:hypothetical protein
MVQGPNGLLLVPAAGFEDVTGLEAKTLGELVDKNKNNTKRIAIDEDHLTIRKFVDVLDDASSIFGHGKKGRTYLFHGRSKKKITDRE